MKISWRTLVLGFWQKYIVLFFKQVKGQAISS